MSLRGKRIVVLVEKQYEDLELWYPKLRLAEEGVEVVVAGTGETSYDSKHGYPVTADAQIGALQPSDFDGVIVPGGWAPDYLRRYDEVKTFVSETARAGKLVAAICHGGSVLVSADVLRGRKMTSVTAIRDDLVNAGAEWIDAEVVVDGGLVSSRRPTDLPAFMRAIIEVLEQRRTDPTARAEVTGTLIQVKLNRSSFEYILDMLGRMPHARHYHGEGLDSNQKDLKQVLQDFAKEADPKGSLEAEKPVVVDVTTRDGGYVARGSERLYEVLKSAEVPGLEIG
jgi:protease I